MTVRVLLVVAVLMALYGCGQADPAPEQGEKKGGVGPKTVTPSGTDQQETTQASWSPRPEAVIGESLEEGSFDLRVLDYFVTDRYYYLTDPEFDDIQDSFSEAGKFVVVNYSLTNTSLQTISPTPFAQLHASSGEVYDQTRQVYPPHRIDPELAVDDIPPRGMFVSQFIFDVPSDVEPELLTITNEPTITRSLDVGMVDLTSESPQGPGPDEIFALQMEYYNMTAWEQAYELFAQESKARVPEQVFVSKNQQEDQQNLVSFTKYSFPSVKIEGEHATMKVVRSLSYEGGGDQDRVTQEAVLEDEGWRTLMREEQYEYYSE